MISIKNEFYKKKFYDISKLVIILVLLALALFVGYKIIFYLLPFALAFLLSSIIEPFVRFLMFKLNMKRKFAALVSVFMFYVILSTLAIFIVIKASVEIITLFNFLNNNGNIIDVILLNFYSHLNPYVENVSNLFVNFPNEVYLRFQNTLSDILNSGLLLIKNLISSLISSAFSLPSAIIFIIVMILSTYFFSSDRVLIYKFFKRNLPDSWINKLVIVKRDIFSTLGGYIKTQFILVSITFLFLSIGFLIGGIKYALTLAFVISLLDFLPMIGTSTIMIPWIVYCFVVGDLKTAFLLLVILAICVIVRQIIEPRILGHNIGVHPLLTLFGAFIGLKLFGFIGIIIMPIFIVVLKNILTEIFKLFSMKEILSFKKEE
jgi:sporulation integral membrane protein YtvI